MINNDLSACVFLALALHHEEDTKMVRKGNCRNEKLLRSQKSEVRLLIDCVLIEFPLLKNTLERHHTP